MNGFSDRRAILGMMGSLTSGVSLSRTGATSSARPLLAADDPVSITRFGAIADGRTDNTAAINAAIAYGTATGRPIFIPAARSSYCIGSTITPTTGILGQGRGSVLQAIPGAFADGSGMVQIGSEEGDDHIPCTVPVNGFAIVGNAERTAMRGTDPQLIGFNGSGLVYAGTAANIHAFDVTVERCRKGIVHANNRGHLGGTNIRCANNWYNLWWERNTGDYRYIDCVLTGALFATYGCHGSDRGGTDVGGISGLTTVGCHGGFSPYILFQEDGNGTVGITGWTAINSSNEQVGNQVVRLGHTVSGKRRVSREWNLVSVGHTWASKDSAEHRAYAIQDVTRAPQQEYAIDLDLVQGSAIDIAGAGWLLGSSGYHTRIRDLLAWVHDANGIGGYDIRGQGRERLVYAGAPALRVVLPCRHTTNAERPEPLAVVDIPPSYDNTPSAVVEWSLAFDNPGVADTELVMVVTVQGRDGNAEHRSQPQHLAAGRGNLSGFLQVEIGRRDRRVNRHRLTVACQPSSHRLAIELEGQIAITVAQNTGVVG